MNEEKDEFDRIEREIQERANTYQKNTLKTKMTKQTEFQQALNLLELALDKLDELIKNVDIKKSKQKPIMWKMVPVEPTNEMIKAMDECSTEGYDERLLAGHAASVYMAAVNVAPTPPQRKPLSMQERTSIVRANKSFHDKNEIDAYGVIDDVEAAHGIKE